MSISTLNLLVCCWMLVSSFAGAASWRTLARMPAGNIHEHSVVALSPTQLVSVGGVLQQGGPISSVYLYDLVKDSWKKLASLPVTINHANAAVVDGKLYVLGGMTGSGWVGNPTTWLYDQAADKWTTLASMPASEARGSAVMGVYNKTVWLASGKTKSGGESVATVSAFDTATGRWLDTIPAKAKNLPEGRDHGGGGIVGTKYYQIAGSLGPLTNRTDTVFVLDLENLAAGWARAKGRMPTPRRGFATALIGSKFYTFGGEGNPVASSNGVYNEVEVYDTTTDTWASLGRMPIAKHGSYAVAANGSIYIPGGGTASGTPATDIFDVFTP